MRRKLITAGLGLLALLSFADWVGGAATSIPWAMILGLPIVAVIAAYLVYLAILKVSGRAANDAHDKRVGARMPKIIVAVIVGVSLAAAIPYYGPILLHQAQDQAGATAGGIASSLDATTTGAQAALPPAWVIVAIPVLIAAAVWWVVRGEDAEAKTVRGVAVVVTGLMAVIVSALTGVLA